MPRGNASGYKLGTKDIPIVLGMLKRGDRDHDVAAWFGVNQGRIADAKDGKWGLPNPAPANELPPKGPPGVKGRRLREAADGIAEILNAKGGLGAAEALTALKKAIAGYDKHEA